MSEFVELVLLFAAIVVIVFTVGKLLRGRARQRRERGYVEQLRGDDEESSDEVDLGAGVTGEEYRIGLVERRLRAAGLGLPPWLWIVLSVIFGLVVFVLMRGALPGFVLPSLLVGGVFAYLPWVLLGEWGRRRARRFEAKLADAVDYMASALESGENALNALQSAADASQEPVGRELAAVAARLEAGAEIRAALEPMRAAFDSEGVRILTSSLLVKWRSGGDLVPVLRSVAWTMRERIRTTLRLRSELAGVQVAAIMVGVLPYLLIPFFLVTRPGWSATLLQHPAGPSLLVGAIVLQIVGFLMLRRILKIEF